MANQSVLKYRAVHAPTGTSFNELTLQQAEVMASSFSEVSRADWRFEAVEELVPQKATSAGAAAEEARLKETAEAKGFLNLELYDKLENRWIPCRVKTMSQASVTLATPIPGYINGLVKAHLILPGGRLEIICNAISTGTAAQQPKFAIESCENPRLLKSVVEKL